MKPRPILVGDLMARHPVSAHPGWTVTDAWEEMSRSDVRHLPVVAHDGKLLGLVSDRDLRAHQGTVRGRGGLLASVMITDVLTVQPRTPAREAALLMLEHKVGSLVVVDGHRRLCGMLTETDLVRLAFEGLGGDRLSVDEH